MFWMEEEMLANAWKEGHYYSEMGLTKFTQIVKQGFTTCDDREDCTSADVCGDDACACIRSIFPHPDYYKAYQLLREELMKTELEDAIKAMDIRKETYEHKKTRDNKEG